MNYSIIRYIVGMTLILEGGLMVPSCAVSVIYGETSAFGALAASAAACVILGLLLRYKKPSNSVFYAREGFVTVAL